jgi:PAS domain S-box-containing protein
MLGAECTELRDRTILDFISPQSHASFRKALERIQKNGLDDYQIDLTRKDGALLPVEIRSAATRDDTGQYSGCVALIKDVSEERRMQNELIQSERLSAVGQLASGIAHEFNNILAIIKGNLFLIKEEMKGQPELLNLLSVMDLQITRGASIVSQMMAFARPQPPQKRMMTVSKLIDDVFLLQKSQLELENIRIEKEYSSTGLIQADPNQLQQVFLNLSINARHAIASKGKGTIRVSVKETGEMIKITFSDDGCGMDEETQKQIFTPFFTTKFSGKEGGKKKSEGTGLGLSVTRNVISRHGGSISFSSTPGEGTTFVILLPKGTVEENQQQALPEKEKSLLKKQEAKTFSPSFLIIDDEKDLADLLQKILKKAGYSDIRSASKGLEGIRMMEEKPADLIFLDKLLPDMNGEEIYLRLKAIKNNLKVVFMSGNAEAEDFHPLPEDMYAFLQKPFELDDLIDLVRKFQPF